LAADLVSAVFWEGADDIARAGLQAEQAAATGGGMVNTDMEVEAEGSQAKHMAGAGGDAIAAAGAAGDLQGDEFRIPAVKKGEAEIHRG
jgi:hypothetical protein